MNLTDRIIAFTELGSALRSLPVTEKESLQQKAHAENSWFTPSNINIAIENISSMLTNNLLTQWVSNYDLNDETNKTVGVAMAGNIPLVSFHDFLSVLISGNRIKMKLSHLDVSLPTFIAQKLLLIEPRFEKRIEFAERLNGVDAVIATGSDNTSRYFEYYFRNIPHIIRKNRSSLGIIVGEEPADELVRLGKDVFTYFGLGCRNVSKLLLPEGLDLTQLIRAFDIYSGVGNHNKYMNNYDYQKSIFLVNGIPFLDTGFLLLREDAALVSPLSVLYYEFYSDQKDLRDKIKNYKDKLQCISSAKGWFEGSVEFGKTQSPLLNEYADNIDTLRFLKQI